MRAAGMFVSAAWAGILLAGCADLEAVSPDGSAASQAKCVVPRLASGAAAPAAEPADKAAKTGPAGTAESAGLLNPDEARAAYDCIVSEMHYTASGHRLVALYPHWQRRDAAPILSEPHGGRYVAVFANEVAVEPHPELSDESVPVGAVLATPSFSVKENGVVEAGRLILIEKMQKGFNSSGGNWRYTVVDPSGKFLGVTNGRNGHALSFCRDCSVSTADAIYTALLNGEPPPKPQLLDPAAAIPATSGAAIPPVLDPMAPPVPNAAPTTKVDVLDPKQSLEMFKSIPGFEAPAVSGAPADAGGGQEVLDPMRLPGR